MKKFGDRRDGVRLRLGGFEKLWNCLKSKRSENEVHILKELDVDDDTLIIYRKYNLDGKGVIKVNGQTVTANMLKRITSHLVDVHGQSEHFSLLKEEEQLAVIDNYYILFIKIISKITFR